MPNQLEKLSNEMGLTAGKVLEHYLNENNLVKSKTAEALGMDFKTLQRKIKIHKITFKAHAPTNNAQSNES